MASDLHHTRELIARYYPDAPLKPLARPGSPPTKHVAAPFTAPLTKFYSCCHYNFCNSSRSFDHYFENHFANAVKSVAPNPCRTLADVGNPAIPVVKRVAYFLASIESPPKNPRLFRPAPLSRGPLRFNNPYSVAMAMAYDFLETLRDQPPEYADFVTLVDLHASLANIPNVSHWACWAHFKYPGLNHSPSGIGGTIQPLFFCQMAGCHKLYKQLTGLQQHLCRDHKSPDTREICTLLCPFTPCDKAYQSSTGLRNHLKKFHLQPHHFEEDRHAVAAPATCPIDPCAAQFPSLAALRLHILNTHFWSITRRRRLQAHR